jgi:hypothetical protein
LNRYRLRFLLQEIDLPQGETLLGRSASCHVTIEDPLVSRQHAKIRIDGDKVTVEDLGSRNGLQLNGRVLRGTHAIKDGDRIRIGTQELVFCSVVAQPSRGTSPATRQTGFMCHCAACGLPYPAELLVCPSCGSTERSDDDTLSGIVADSQRRNWTLDLVVEVLQKAQSLERWEDVERMLRRARSNVEERIAQALPVERPALDAVADAAAALAASRGEAEWARWMLGVYATLGLVPRLQIPQRLSLLPPAERATLAPEAARVVDSVNQRGGPPAEDREGFAGIASLGAETDSGAPG